MWKPAQGAARESPDASKKIAVLPPIRNSTRFEMLVSVTSFWGANRWVAAAQTSVLHPHDDHMAVMDSVQGDVSRKRRMPQGA